MNLRAHGPSLYALFARFSLLRASIPSGTYQASSVNQGEFDTLHHNRMSGLVSVSKDRFRRGIKGPVLRIQGEDGATGTFQRPS